MKRMANLIEAGIDSESAEATVDKFESLDDEAFEAMTSLFAGKLPPWLEKFKKKEDKAMMMRKASEEAVVEQLTALIDTIDLDEIGMKEKIKVEIKRAASTILMIQFFFKCTKQTAIFSINFVIL